MTNHTYTITDRPDFYPPEHKRRFRVRGYPCSWDSGEDEIEVPEECPSISTGGCGVIHVDGEVRLGVAGD